MASIKEDILLDVFNMLMERTTKLEKTIDQAMIHGQMNSIGALDTSFFGLPYDVFVHEPLDKLYKGLDKYAAFYIETDVEYPYDSLLRHISDGVFDTAFGSKAEIIKKDARDEIIGENDDTLHMPCREIPSVHTKRVKLRELLIDLIIQRYATGKMAKSPVQIHYDPINVMTSFFVFVKKSSSSPRFSFLEELTNHVQKITERIDPTQKVNGMTICPLTETEASTMMASHNVLDEEDMIVYDKYSSKYPSQIRRLVEKLKNHMFWRSTSPFVRASRRPDYY